MWHFISILAFLESSTSGIFDCNGIQQKQLFAKKIKKNSRLGSKDVTKMHMTRSVSLNLSNFRQENNVAFEETVALKHFNLYRSYGTCGNFTPYVPKFRQFLTHVVKEHETLAGIALKYDLTTEDIKRTNSFLWTSNSVWVGQVIKVPVHLDPDQVSDKIVRIYLLEYPFFVIEG